MLGDSSGKWKSNIVTNQDSDPVFVKKIYNEGESGKNYFTGAKRHIRSRIVTVAGNVNQFVQEFNDMVQADQKTPEKTPEENN